MSEPRAWIVVGLGFGDCGKGTITDHLVRAKGAELVVRFNGGAQAGHNVVLPDGRHHTFAQLGAGTFAGARTHLAKTVVVHPSALQVEARVLRARGVADPLAGVTIDGHCRVTTPFHQAAGRLRELARGARAHGTCGVGVGETVRDALAHPADALRMGELAGPDAALLAKLERIRRRLMASLPAGPDHEERALLQDPTVGAAWLALIAEVRARVRVVDDEQIAASVRGDLVFEGAQGVLLDEHAGFHPHTTWSTCTSAWAEDWLAEHRLPHRPFRLGVTRTTLTRHGPGPLPSETPALRAALPEPHNGDAGWQGAFRVGWLDLPLLRYAVAANGGLDGLALTHLDRLAARERWQVVEAYPVPLAPSPGDLAAQARLTEALGAAEPALGAIDPSPEGFAARLERELALPVEVRSHGPTFRDKR